MKSEFRFNGNSINYITSLSHRTKDGGRNKYSKSHRHYTRDVPKKMPRDRIPDGYEQPKAPNNNALAVALKVALAAQKEE